ncbi:MAG: ureidoglycolate lyase [Pseudomonadota bacterium]
MTVSRDIVAAPLTAEAFQDFGDIIALKSAPDRMINGGWCGRHHDLADIEIDAGRAGVSLFDARPRDLPYSFDLLERHPLGSQCFLPMTGSPFLVIVAPDEGGAPGAPRAFLTAPYVGVNYARGVWHGVLTPLAAPGLFAVIDRIGDGPNLEEATLAPPWRVVPPTPSG